MPKHYKIIFGACVILSVLGIYASAHAAPYYRQEATVIPIADSLYDLGTSTKAWRDLFVDQICLSADCKTAWPTGGGGGDNPFTQVAGGSSTSTLLYLYGGLYSLGSTTIEYASSTAISAPTICIGTDCRTVWPASGSGVWPFTTTDTNYGVAVQSTTTPEWFKNGVFASTTSHFVYASTTAITAQSANILRLDNLASAGFVKTSAIGTLSVDTTTYESGLTAGDGLTRTSNDFDCDTADTNTFGCLLADDWDTFNNKVPTTITLTAGNGLTGGGDLSANRTFTVGVENGLAVSTDVVGIDITAVLNGTLLQYNGTRLAATGTPALTVGYLIATTTTASQLPYASSTALNTSGQTLLATGGANVGIGTTTPFWTLQVASATPYFTLTDTDAGTNAKHGLISFLDGLFRFGTSSDLLSATSSVETFGVDIAGHRMASTSAPTLSSGVVDGTDAYGWVNGCSSACTLTFATAYSRRPACVVKEETESVVNALTYTVSNTAIVVTQTGLANWNYVCNGR